VYYSEPNTKLTFLDNLVTGLDLKNNLIIDFDTQLTNLKRNKSLGLEFELFTKSEIFLPYEITLQAILDKVTNYFTRDSLLIVIDSLNGLIDYFGTYFYEKFDKNTKAEYSKKLVHSDSQLGFSNQNAGYIGFSFLNILFRNQFVSEIPIVITSYISQRSLDKLILELEKGDHDKIVDRNHFRRFSNTVSCLGYLNSHNTLIATVIKKKEDIPGASTSDTAFRPRSIKISTK
jgi:hypothetical protein